MTSNFLARPIIAPSPNFFPVDRLNNPSVLRQKAPKEINYGPPSDLDQRPRQNERLTKKKKKKRKKNVGQSIFVF